MRKILVSLIVLLAASLASSGAPPDRLPSLVAPAQAGGIMLIQQGVPAVSQSPEWFGNTNLTGMIWSDYGAYFFFIGNSAAATYTCPGTGSRKVSQLLAYVKTAGSKFRLGIYNETTLVCEGTAAITIVSATGAWEGHATAATIKSAGGSGNDCNLTAGTGYRFGIAREPGAAHGMIPGSTADEKYAMGTDYTGGMPAGTAASVNDSNILSVKAYVE